MGLHGGAEVDLLGLGQQFEIVHVLQWILVLLNTNIDRKVPLEFIEDGVPDLIIAEVDGEQALAFDEVREQLLDLVLEAHVLEVQVLHRTFVYYFRQVFVEQADLLCVDLVYLWQAPTGEVRLLLF